MDGTSKIVDEIADKFLDELSKVDGIDSEFKNGLAGLLKDDKKVTAQKLEQMLYGEADSV